MGQRIKSTRKISKDRVRKIRKQKNKIIIEAKNYAYSKGIKMISSSPSIELWFLLHYEYTTAYLS